MVAISRTRRAWPRCGVAPCGAQPGRAALRSARGVQLDFTSVSARACMCMPVEVRHLSFRAQLVAAALTQACVIERFLGLSATFVARTFALS